MRFVVAALFTSLSIAAVAQDRPELHGSDAPAPAGVLTELPWIGNCVELELGVGGEFLEGHGPCRVLDYEAPFDGTLCVSAMSAEVDSYLQIRDLDGHVLAEDDNSGAAELGRDAWLKLEAVHEGDPLEIVVAATGRPTGGRASVRLKLFEAREDPGTLAAARRLGVAHREARVALASGDAGRAREIAARALQALEGTELPPSLAVANQVMFLGEAAFDAHDPGVAATLWTLGREVLEHAMPTHHRELQLVRWKLANAWEQAGEFASARRLLEQVSEVFGHTLPLGHRDRISVQLSLGAAIKAQRELALARTHFEQLLAELESVLPKEAEALWVTRVNLGATLIELGEYREAEQHLQPAIAVMESTLPENDPRLPAAWNNLATIANRRGDFERGRQALERVIEVLQPAVAANHRFLQLARMNLATTLREEGDLTRARALYELVDQGLSSELGESHPEVIEVRLALAAVLRVQGDLVGAQAIQEHALAVRTSRLAEDHADVLEVQTSLAATLGDQGELRTAEELFAGVFAARTRSLPKDHALVMEARRNLAAVQSARGELDEARKLQEEDLRVLASSLPPNHPRVLVARSNLAVTLRAQGHAEAALDLMDDALASSKENLPPGHPFLERVQAVQLRNAIDAGDAKLAAAIAAALAEDMLTVVQSDLLLLSRRQWGEWVRRREVHVASALALASLSTDLDVERQFLLLESLREIGATRDRVRRIVQLPPDVEIALENLQRELFEVRAKIRRALYDEGVDAGFERSLDTSSMESFAALKRRQEQLQVQSAKIQDRWKREQDIALDARAAAIAEALPVGTAAVGFWRYRRLAIDFDARELGESESAYLAMVLRRDRAPQRIELSTDSDIRAALYAWFDAFGAEGYRGGDWTPSEQESEAVTGERLRTLVFDPLRDALGDCRHVILVADGVMHLVPFGALPGGRSSGESGTLADHFDLEFRTTLKELTVARRSELHPPRLLALGGIEYGVPPSGEPPAVATAPVAEAAEPSGSWDDVVETELRSPIVPVRRNHSALEFGLLTGSDDEIEHITQLFDARFGGDGKGSRSLRGLEATRERFARLAPHARYLHLATHGYVERDERGSIPTTIDVSLREDQTHLRPLFTDRLAQVRGLSPMSITGIALSSANVEDEEIGGQVGLMTADEIADLDLSGCELVVFSSCGSGVGLERAGQGLASLRHAAYIAGARMSLTSVYDVPNHSTRELMTRFYDRWWRRGMPPRSALADAQRSMREEKDSHGRPKYRTLDWAAWTLVGSGR